VEPKDITGFYSEYKRSLHKSISIEDDFYGGISKKEWVDKLINKSNYLRKTYIHNEEKIKEIIYPFISGEKALNDELADTFFNEISKLIMNVEDNYLLTTSMLEVLEKYYSSKNNTNKLILVKFFLGLSFADRALSSFCVVAENYFDEVVKYSDIYTKIDDFDVRRRIVFAYYNRIANFHCKNEIDIKKSVELLEEAITFYKKEDVRKLDKDKIDFDEMINESICSFLIEISDSSFDIDKNLVNEVLEKYVPKDINFKNYLEKNSIFVLAYIWANYKLNKISINEAFEYLYAFYRNKDKLVVYSNPYFYEDEEYQTQTLYMSKCFKWLADDRCKIEHKKAIKSELISDFKHLYKSIPYLTNNSLLNNDMIDILTNLLKSETSENEAIEFINEIIIRRNSMTLIHSTMVSKISVLVAKSLIKNKPSLFYNLLDTDDDKVVFSKTKYLLDYIKKASLIHDLGRSWISDVINLQIRRITSEEYLEIKTHPQNGADIINGTILEEKYNDMILGHHKYYDNSGGYPTDYDNLKSNKKILTDILTIADCIDAATDTLGRNYSHGKSWDPIVLNELLSDDKRYNHEIMEVINGDDETKKAIGNQVDKGRINVYFDIYNKYLGNKNKK